ncbi:hypothetical protein LMH87_000152 [Akanthomyces muscarius]|uniref:Uncharacterized protein n=1 Tax=Akanthomyces muscarius TaxID=2231603 RepID=A0A9W8UKV0_AKAMU|nr:hypothetical protein LMH87_000152 [Akanthomyces muscarius]KAJ4154878.1 hypothetical protein LMH87_000152 [Akanthomyces muscarius]
MPSYVLTGRGGAGNTHRLAPSSSSSPSTTKKPVAASTTSSSSTPRIVSSGVGGAGNMRALDAGARSSAAHALQQDMRRAAARDRHPVGYAGRGGAGNAYAYAGSSASDADDDASLLSGSSAASSVAERARGWASRVSGSFSRS